MQSMGTKRRAGIRSVELGEECLTHRTRNTGQVTDSLVQAEMGAASICLHDFLLFSFSYTLLVPQNLFLTYAFSI